MEEELAAPVDNIDREKVNNANLNVSVHVILQFVDCAFSHKDVHKSRGLSSVGLFRGWSVAYN